MALSIGRFRRSLIPGLIRGLVRTSGIAGSALAWALMPSAVLPPGVAPEPSSWVDVLLAWSIEAHVILPLLAAWFLYRWAVRRVNATHAANPVPRFRAWGWYGGL